MNQVTCVQIPASHWPCSAAPSSCGTGACALRADAQDDQLHGWRWPHQSKKQERRAGLIHSPHIPCQDLVTPLHLTCWRCRPRNGEPRAAPDQADGWVLRTVFPEKEGLCWGWSGVISRVMSWGQRKAISRAKLMVRKGNHKDPCEEAWRRHDEGVEGVNGKARAAAEAWLVVVKLRDFSISPGLCPFLHSSVLLSVKRGQA